MLFFNGLVKAVMGAAGGPAFRPGAVRRFRSKPLLCLGVSYFPLFSPGVPEYNFGLGMRDRLCYSKRNSLQQPVDQPYCGRATVFSEGRVQRMKSFTRNLSDILRDSRDKLRVLVDGIPEPMFTVNRDLKVVSLNMAFAGMLNAHPKDVVGRSCHEVACRFVEPYRFCSDEHCLARTFFESGRTIRRYLEKPGPDGKIRCMEVVVSPVFDLDGELNQAVVQYRDVTPLKQLEEEARNQSRLLEEEVDRRTAELRNAQDELLQEKARLEVLNRELVELEKLKNILIQTIVHDMKGPLGEVMGNLDLIRTEPLSKDQEEYLEMADLACDDLLRMVMNLLDTNRLEEGRLKPHSVELDPAQMLERVVRRFQALSRLKKQAVSVHTAGGVKVVADQGLLERILQNLFINAVEATPEGGRIDLGVEPSETPEWVRCYVRDTGRGIPEAFKPLIFQKFARLSGEAGVKTGTGLGLSFCKMAVEAHGGVIGFESREGGGTRFFFTLPGTFSTGEAGSGSGVPGVSSGP